jgi:hypothetical protein
MSRTVAIMAATTARFIGLFNIVLPLAHHDVRLPAVYSWSGGRPIAQRGRLKRSGVPSVRPAN